MGHVFPLEEPKTVTFPLELLNTPENGDDQSSVTTGLTNEDEACTEAGSTNATGTPSDTESSREPESPGEIGSPGSPGDIGSPSEPGASPGFIEELCRASSPESGEENEKMPIEDIISYLTGE